MFYQRMYTIITKYKQLRHQMTSSLHHLLLWEQDLETRNTNQRQMPKTSRSVTYGIQQCEDLRIVKFRTFNRKTILNRLFMMTQKGCYLSINIYQTSKCHQQHFWCLLTFTLPSFEFLVFLADLEPCYIDQAVLEFIEVNLPLLP